jgi:hypothetical protein
MNSDYRAVFVVTEKGFEWRFPAFGLLFSRGPIRRNRAAAFKHVIEQPPP